jgi:hypothetical protein
MKMNRKIVGAAGLLVATGALLGAGAMGRAPASAPDAASTQPAKDTKKADQPKPAEKPAATPAAAKADHVGDPYTLATCPISGKKLGAMGDPVIKVYDGREVRFCCDQCPATFEKDKAKSWAKVDEQIIKDQRPLYPLETSVVSGKKLSEAPGGKAIEYVYGNRLFLLASEGKKADLAKDAKKHFAALDKAVVEKQGKDYPLTTCPISKEKLGEMGKPVDNVIAGRLVRTCCKDCVADLSKDPAKVVAMVDAARKGGAAPKDGDKK